MCRTVINRPKLKYYESGKYKATGGKSNIYCHNQNRLNIDPITIKMNALIKKIGQTEERGLRKFRYVKGKKSSLGLPSLN